MYKVFIKECPLFIVKNSEVFNPERGATAIDSSELEQTVKDILEGRSKERTMYIMCENEEDVLNRLKQLFTPVEAAGGIVRNKRGETLFIFRNEKWDLPKGKCEKGEPHDLAAIREVQEECGIDAPEITGFNKKTYHMYSMRGENCIKTTWWYNMHLSGDEKALIPQTEEGITEAVWVREEEIKDKLLNTYASIRELF